MTRTETAKNAAVREALQVAYTNRAPRRSP